MVAKTTPAQATTTPATPAQVATPTPTPANLVTALQSATKQQQQGVFLQAANAAFNAQLPLYLNGVQAPQRAGACANVWLQVLAHLQAHNTLPTCAQVVAALPSANTNNTKIEAYRCFKWLQGVPAYVSAQAQQ